MKLRLPVRLKLAVLAGLRSVVQATLASGFLAVGAVFFSFSAQAEDDPVALEVAEDEDEAAVPVDDEAPAAKLGVSAAELNDSQASALAEAEQEHAAELGINATSSAVSQAAIEAQDAAVSPAQAAGGSHADSFAAVPAADSPALTLPAAEGAVAPSLCAEGAADFATDYAPIKTASVAVLPQSSTSLTLSEDVVMASTPVAEAAQTSSSSSSAVAVSSSSSSGGAVACGGGAAGGGGGSSASFSASVPVTDASSSGSDLPSDSVVSAEDPSLSPSEPSPSLPDDSELVDTSPSSDSSSLSDAASLSSSLSASASTTGASSSSPAARSFSLKLLGATATSETESTGTSESATPVSGSGSSTMNHSLSTSSAASLNEAGYNSGAWTSTIEKVCKSMTAASGFTSGNLYGRGNNNTLGDWNSYEGSSVSVTGTSFRIYGRNGVGGEWMGSAYQLTFDDDNLLNTAGILSTSVSLKITEGTLTSRPSYILETGIVQIKGNSATLLVKSGLTALTSFDGSELTLQAESLFEKFSYDSSASYYVIFRIAGTGSTTPYVTSYNTVTVDSWSTRAVNRLIWSGTSEPNVWSASSEVSNWTLGENSTQYQSGAAVSFTADAASKTVNLEGDLTPYSVSVSGGAYSFQTQNDTTTSTLAPETKVSIASGASLDIGPGVTLNGNDLSVEGVLTNSAGATTFTGLANVSGTVNVTGGSLTLSGTNNFTDGATLSKGESAEMSLSGTNQVFGTIKITGGNVALSGTNNLAAGTSFVLSNGATAALSGTSVIAGDLTVSGGALELGGTITNNGTGANLKVGAGGSYSVVVSEGNKLTYEGFEIWKEVDSDAVLGRSNAGQISLLDTEVTYANVSLRKVSTEEKIINATLTNVAFTNTGDAETDIAGTATFSSLTNEGTNLKVSRTATINGQLSTGSTITNTGTINFGEGATIVLTSLDGLGGLYKDTLNPGISSGYLDGRLLINGGTTTKAESLSDLTAKCGETIYNLTFGTDYVLLNDTGETGEQRRYYINAGDSLLYGDESNSLASDSTSSIVLNGGTLEIGTDSLGKATVLQKASSLRIQDGATFNASNIVSTSSGTSEQIATNGMTLTLTGAGTYSISKNSGGFDRNSLGVTLGNDWAGTVKLSGGAGSHTLSDLVNGSLSTIEMCGVTGWSNKWNGNGNNDEAANIRLTDVVNDNGTTTYAWENGAFSSTGYNTCTFSGKWSGQGRFVATTSNNEGRQHYSYSGDISGWSGQFRLKWTTKYAMTLTFTGDASEVNASIYEETGTLNITASAAGGTSFANSIKASSLAATSALRFGGTIETEDQISGNLNANENSVTIGQNVKLTVGGMTTAGSLTNAGTANLNGGATISGNLTNTGTLAVGGDVTISPGAKWTSSGAFSVSGNLEVNTESSFSFTEGALSVGELVNRGTVTIGAADRGAAVSLGGVLTNEGTLSLYASSLTFSGDLLHSLSDGTYEDNGKVGNGFITGGRAYIIKQGNGASLTYTPGKVVIGGVSYDVETDNAGVYVSMSGTAKAVLDSTYFVNEGKVVYRASDNSTGNPKVTELCLTGGTLKLASENLDSGVGLLVTGDSTVSIGAGRTLSEEVLTLSRGSLTLTGAGTYRMAAADFGETAALTKGVVLGAAEDASFTGTVWLSSGTTLAGTDLSGLTKGTSSVTLNGVSGYLKTDGISTKLVLTNNGAVPALAINYGTDNETRTFSGSISGTGTMARTNRMNGKDTVESGETQNFKFTGNIEGWTGVFDNQVSKTTNLTFGGDATTVNATLKHTAKGGVLNVSTEKDVIFNGGMSVTTLTAGLGSTITLNGNSKVSGAVRGSFVVGKGGSLTVGDAASLTEDNVASLTSLTVSDGGSVTLNGTATATGKVTVSSGGYLALGTGGLTLSGGSASLELADGAIVALKGWTADSTDEKIYSESGVKTINYTGGKLFSLAADFIGSAPTFTNVNFTVVKDGASFTGNRVTVESDGTVTITDAVFYNVASGKETTIDVATSSTVDYINVLGTLTGVNKDNIGSLGFGASNAKGVYGDGTLKLDGELKDGYYLSSFTGTIAIGAGSTFVTDGNVDRTIKLEGGTLHATADMTLKNVSAAGGASNKIEVDAGKAVIITSSIGAQSATASITKTGEGTLTLGAINDSGNYIRGTMYGDLTVEKGEVVLVTPNNSSGDTGAVVGNITIEAGGTVTANGVDPLGYSNNTWSMNGSPTCTKTLTMEGSENAYAVLNIASGQHVTLSTEVYMNGYAQINGRLLNAWSSTQNTGGEKTSYVKASGLGNVINADFYLRHHALFEVEGNGELSLNGSILKFTLGGAFDKPIFRKAGEGTLILDSPTATTLYNLRIEKGEVRISTDLSFDTASELADFSMTRGSRFTVVDDGRFTYGGWTYEMKDGSSAKATVTAGADTTGALLSQGGITITDTKLTNTAANTNTDTNTLIISAKLDNVAFTQDNSGAVTIANAKTDTQHLSSLAVNAGTVTLNNAQLDTAKVASGATLNFTKGTTITLGSTIQNAGTVALTGTADGGVSFTIDLNNLSGFDVYGTAGYSDAKYSGSSDQDARVGYNGFYKGQTYYLVKNAGGNVDLSGATIKGAVVGQSESGGSYYFETTDKDTKYYINNSSQQDTNYKYSADAENSMYGGYLGAEDADHFATSGIVMEAENGRLILATNLREDEGNAVSDGIIMRQAGSITVESGVTLKQSSLNLKSTAEATLKGAGIYEVGGTALSDIAKGFADPDWKGTVQVIGEATGMKLSYMGHAGSTVQMTGVYGTLEDTVTDAKTYAMDIALVNGENSAPALEFTANNGSRITFSGAMSGAATNTDTGEGSTMKVSGATAQTVQNITFTGDMSGWNGAFEAGKGTVNLTLTGDATVVNAGIGAVGSAGILNVTIDATKDRIFNKEVTAENLTVDTQTGESTGKIVLQGLLMRQLILHV